MIRSTPLRTLAWLALFLAALYPLYLVTANTLLNSDWGRRQLDRAPQFTLDWERAWTAHCAPRRPNINPFGRRPMPVF